MSSSATPIPVWLEAMCAQPEQALALGTEGEALIASWRAQGWPIWLEGGVLGFAPGWAPLSHRHLAAALAPLGLGLFYRPAVDSTQEEAKRLLAAGEAAPFLVVAEWQSAGRGRWGRRWLSPPLSALLATLVAPIARAPSALAGLAPALGVALAEALIAAGGGDIRVKWPNDLLKGGRKLGGVLVEVLPRGAQGVTLLVGFGLNVCPEAAQAAPVPAACWAEDDPCPDRTALLLRLVPALCAAIAEFGREGFLPFRVRFAGLDALAGQSLSVHAAGGRIEGRALGLSEEGALLLATASGQVAVSTGEVQS